MKWNVDKKADFSILFGMRRMVFTIISIYFLLYLVCNTLYPWRGDDFMCHYLARTQTPFQMIADGYLNWTLRLGNIISTFIEFCSSKILFNILNSVVQIALIWLLAGTALGRTLDVKKSEDLLLMLFAAGISVFVCRPADTVYWVPGAVLYSWAAVVYTSCYLILLANEKRKSNGAANLLLLVFIGFCSGYSNENVALTLILFLGVRAFLKPSRALFYTLGGVIAGAGLLFTTPGAVKRIASEAGTDFHLSPLSMLAKVPEIIAFYIGSSIIPLAVLGVMAIICFRKVDRTTLVRAGICLGLSVFAALVFAGCPLPPMRSYYVCSILVVLSSCILFQGAKLSLKSRSIIAFASATCGLLMLLSSLPDFCKIYQDEQTRSRLITKQKQQGVDIVCVPEHRILRRSFLQYIFIEDITDDPDFFLNKYAALYYDVKKIKSIPGKEQVPLFRQKFLQMIGIVRK